MKNDWEKIIYEDAVYKISTSKQKLKQKQYLKKGIYPIVDQGQDLIGGYTNDKNKVIDCDLPVLVFGDHTRITKLIDFKFVPGADGTKILEPSKFILPQYLSIFTKVLTFKIKDNGYARHYQHIEKEFLPLAPLPIQRAIVSKIETLFSDLDNGIAQFKKAQAQLKIYRQAVLKKAFEGGFTRDFAGKSDDVGTRQTFPQKPQTNNEISDNLPKGWKWVKLGEVIEKPKYGTSKKCDYKNGNVGVLRIPNISSGFIDDSDLKFAEFSSDEISDLSLIEGDILTIRSNGSVDLVGKCALIKKSEIKYLYAGYLIRLRPFKKILNSHYLLYLMYSIDLRVQIESFAKSTSGVNNINSVELSNLIIPLCSLEEQTQIVQEIERRLSVCDKMEESIKESLKKAEALRQSILKKAFEGKLLSEAEIAQCKAAADYEPASELLKKIQAEKLAKAQKNKPLKSTKNE